MLALIYFGQVSTIRKFVIRCKILPKSEETTVKGKSSVSFCLTEDFLVICGATRNRYFDLSDLYSYRYDFKKTVFSRYCSTKLSHYFAVNFFTTHFL